MATENDSTHKNPSNTRKVGTKFRTVNKFGCGTMSAKTRMRLVRSTKPTDVKNLPSTSSKCVTPKSSKQLSVAAKTAIQNAEKEITSRSQYKIDALRSADSNSKLNPGM